MLIGNAAFRGTGVALGASILLLDYAFDQLGLSVINAKMHHTHTDAIAYNQFLGFQFEKPLSESFQLWVLTKETFQSKRDFLMKMFSSM